MSESTLFGTTVLNVAIDGMQSSIQPRDMESANELIKTLLLAGYGVDLNNRECRMYYGAGVDLVMYYEDESGNDILGNPLSSW